jgi:hypothetical protein
MGGIKRLAQLADDYSFKLTNKDIQSGTISTVNPQKKAAQQFVKLKTAIAKGTPISNNAKGGLQEATARLKAQGLKKGGSPKKKKKFPDLSGDGKVTMKDILMARGVIKKKTKKKGKKK